MDHEVLYKLWKVCKEKNILKVLNRGIKRTVEFGNNFCDIKKGIPTGSPLSNVFGALYLSLLDKVFIKKKNIFYARYMDDVIIMTTSSFTLRKSLKLVYKVMDKLKIKIHRNNKKFYIGKITNGFDFLGYKISPSFLVPTQDTLKNHLDKLHEHYVQRSSTKKIFWYIKRFWTWVRSGLGDYFCKQKSIVRHKTYVYFMSTFF